MTHKMERVVVTTRFQSRLRPQGQRGWTNRSPLLRLRASQRSHQAQNSRGTQKPPTLLPVMSPSLRSTAADSGITAARCFVKKWMLVLPTYSKNWSVSKTVCTRKIQSRPGLNVDSCWG
uniref:SECIS binding protein 2 n=1 Tax=Saimiri boliviensis boliviensis TaxID=39432 RepID=A0A2K6S732_SAIBB